jgi:DNA-binding transcriptional regulator YhcF (GntR family)
MEGMILFWIGLAILIIAGWIIYSRRRSRVSITLTKEQAELALGLIRKEREEIEKKRQKIVDELATQGETLPLDRLLAYIKNKSKAERIELEKIKKDILEKYGTILPIDVVYRLTKQFDPAEESPWSKIPGCFERHLQRREGNLLFPPDRRVVTRKEIEEARERDRIEQQQFIEKVNSFASRIAASLKQDSTPTQAQSVLQETQALLEEAASIEGDIGHAIQALLDIEKKLIQSMNETMLEGKEMLEQIKSMSAMERIPFWAQSKRKDTPILENEIIPTLLSEDLETISVIGYVSRSTPDFKPSEEDIKEHLDKVIRQGFNKERTQKIITAWGEIPQK